MAKTLVRGLVVRADLQSASLSETMEVVQAMDAILNAQSSMRECSSIRSEQPDDPHLCSMSHNPRVARTWSSWAVAVCA